MWTSVGVTVVWNSSGETVMVKQKWWNKVGVTVVVVN